MSDTADVMLILNSHLDYLGRVEDYIAGKIPDPLSTAYDKCKLGSWYYAVTDERIKVNPDFVALGDFHKTFHGIADDAIAAFRAGQIDQAHDKVGQAYALFSQISNKLMTIDDVLRFG